MKIWFLNQQVQILLDLSLWKRTRGQISRLCCGTRSNWSSEEEAIVFHVTIHEISSGMMPQMVLMGATYLALFLEGNLISKAMIKTYFGFNC